MRRLMAVLALATLVAACSDQTTAPATDGPQLARQDGGHGALVRRYTTEDGFCVWWDANGDWVFNDMPCNFIYRPNGTMTLVGHYLHNVFNPTGHALVYGPTRYPQSLADAYYGWLGFVPLVDGRLGLCDWNLLLYPNAPATSDWQHLACTTHWAYTISATGEARADVVWDRASMWFPFPNGRP